MHARNSGSAIIWRWHAPSILCSKFCHTNSIQPLVMSTNRQPHVDQLDLDENSSPAGSTPASPSCFSPSTSLTQSAMLPTGSPPSFSLFNRYCSLIFKYDQDHANNHCRPSPPHRSLWLWPGQSCPITASLTLPLASTPPSCGIFFASSIQELGVQLASQPMGERMGRLWQASSSSCLTLATKEPSVCSA